MYYALINVLLLSLLLQLSIAFHVTPPRSNRDWNQIASLVVQTFDTPSDNNIEDEKDFFSTSQKYWWDVVDKRLTERFTYNSMVRTARKLRGKKYAIFVAKKARDSDDDDSQGDVVGMVELGMAVMDKSISEVGNQRKPYATLGVLCVQDDCRRDGVGSALVMKCEQVVNKVWNESEIYLQVEPCNVAALEFFQDRCGYCNTNEMKNVTIARRRIFEERPHIILKKTFNTTSVDSLEKNTEFVTKMD